VVLAEKGGPRDRWLTRTEVARLLQVLLRPIVGEPDADRLLLMMVPRLVAEGAVEDVRFFVPRSWSQDGH
jgi:hypothetical protein